MKLAMTNFSMKHPRWVLLVTILLALFFAAQFPKVHFDNDPENMLAEDEPVRVNHHRVKDKFALYDFVIVGVVNETHPDGIFNVDTLTRIHGLTEALLSLQQDAEGLPQVHYTAPDGQKVSESIDLRPDDLWRQTLNFAFHQDPNRLFDQDGAPVIVKHELIAPSVVDNLKQAELGSLQLAYLMEEAPKTEAEALAIRDDALNNPLYKDTLVSADGQAIALYIPIVKKTYSYNVANLVRHLTSDWQGDDQLYITGLPVAEDTFGVEMLVQMATSAPLAGLAIFLLLALFFRRLSLIIAPMVLAILSIVLTMGTLIGLGFDVHIMSSMIAIFLMPIAVADSVHVLSEFFDTYPRFKDKAETIRYVIGHLFMPMLYTSLTTIAGFASLAFTPIPPVQIFGAHVALGVGLAWIFTMTLIPAYIMLFVPAKSLESLEADHHEEPQGLLAGLLVRVGRFSNRRGHFILVTAVALIVVAVWGISQIQVNDNPTKWFTPKHEIRVADRVLNKHFGGTYTAYLELEVPQAELNVADAHQQVLTQLQQRRPAFVDQARATFAGLQNPSIDSYFAALQQRAVEADNTQLKSWQVLGDAIIYSDATDLAGLMSELSALEGVAAADLQTLRDGLQQAAASDDALIDRALAIVDANTTQRLTDVIAQIKLSLQAPGFKQPEVLRWVADLQAHLHQHPMVGKTTSLVDALQKANYELKYVADAGEANQVNFAVPDSVAATGQVFAQLESTKRKDSIFHLVTKDYTAANLWLQLKSGDNRDMEAVVAEVERYIEANPAPVAMTHDWAGLTYLNVVWQEKMVTGMLSSLLSSFAVVLIMMILLFRSLIFGLLAMLPLSITITLIYGLIGLVGKDYDMPVAVLSALTLGLSVDFAIHFLQRSREAVAQYGSWLKARETMFREPAVAISRNAITIAVGFTPLLVAPLVPYRTVGFFLATIMLVSWMATLMLLPAMLKLLSGLLFKSDTNSSNA